MSRPSLSGRPILAVALFLVIVLFPPLMRWPLAHLPAHAETLRQPARSTALSHPGETVDGYVVALSNENERLEQEERRGREDNQHEDNENDDWTPPPPLRKPAPPPPPPPDEVEACLQNGQVVTLTLPDGGVTLRVFQDNLYVQLARIDPGSVPPPPGSLAGQLAFRVTAAPCGGSPFDTLPGAANLGISYRNRLAESLNESRLTLMRYDGQQWTVAPGSVPDPDNNYVSASITETGVYAVVQQ
ncbi:MAG: hypothetical protein AB7P40_08955 [Chloroflexota bacterium]